MARFPRWAPFLLAAVAALYGGEDWFTWEVAVATALFVAGLASMTWLRESPAWGPPALLRPLPSMWMGVFVLAAAGLVIAGVGLGRSVPAEAVYATFLLAPLPWAVLGVLTALDLSGLRHGSMVRRGGTTSQG